MRTRLIRSDEVESLGEGAVLGLERAHGNADLIRGLEALGLAGPFTRLSPWELRDPAGVHLIAAGGYAASPFGERYEPLVRFMQEVLAASRAVSLPQQSASAWRAALASNLVALLAAVAPSHADSQVFFSSSGAEAVETALKLARAARAGTDLITFTRSYHGKTLGALSLTPNEEYQAPFRPLLAGVHTLPYGDAQALTDAVVRLGDKLAAVIVEPVQGEGGVVAPPPDFLPAVQSLKERHGFLVIADEVQTGLGRCGHLFASVAGGLEPDILTLAKPLGGGLVAVGATLARRELMQKMLGGLASKRHSNTFGGGTLAMAVGLKSLEIICDEDLSARARDQGARALARLRSLAARFPELFAEVRGAGLLLALQLQPLAPPRASFGFAETLEQFCSALFVRALHQGGVHACYTLNSSRTVRLTPALNLPEPLFETLLERVERVAEGAPKAWQLLKVPPKVVAGLLPLALKRS